ncbi:MAG TPA: ATP-binding cassette domain-containing protein [Sandaracinaceae bacterium LLY-WYZ-13_1]|nr:ATP-binding cassette domain-containing protein [Sandaracinaceae bacterium LLY-WYZ-13_1]
MTLEATLALTRGELDLAVELTCDGVTLVMGPNGAGKTTLLRALLGAETPHRGRVALDGTVLFDAARGIDRPPEERSVAYVPQGYGLFPHLTVEENVRFAVGPGPDAERRARALTWLVALDLEALADRPPRALSGGERQRVALARAMARAPRLLLLDEPLAALDPTARPRVRRFLAEWLEDAAVPALVVSHDAADARAFADDVVVLEEGRVVQHGPPDTLTTRPASAFVAALVPGLLQRDPRSEPPRAAYEDE